MRILGLCFFFIIGVAAMSLAQESSKLELSKATSDPSMTQNSVGVPDRSPAAAQPERWYRAERHAAVRPDTSCAYMRTYRVKREEKGSDAVYAAGYVECVPNRRFEVKSAMQVESAPAAR